MHATGSRTITKNEITPSANATMKATMIIMALTMSNPIDVVLRLEDVMKGDQSFLSQFEESALATELQTVRDREVWWVNQPDWVAWGVLAHHWGHRRGFGHHGKLLAHLPIIISQDMAHGASHRIDPIMVRLVPTVHQQLLGHARATRSQLGPSQHCTKEGRVPVGVYPMLL
jgi:hypothetical protein